MDPKLKTLYYQESSEGEWNVERDLKSCDEALPVHVFKHSFTRHLSVRRTLTVNKPEPTTGNA